MTSEFRTHVAILPSLRAIAVAGGSDIKITNIEGHFSLCTLTQKLQPNGQFLSHLLSSVNLLAQVRWQVAKTGHPLTAPEILADLAKDNIPDIILRKITFAIPYVRYDNCLLKNETFWMEWVFHPKLLLNGCLSLR
jgi:hypothetical protein